MKTGRTMFLWLGVFFLVVAIIYAVSTHLWASGGAEFAGILTLLLCCFMCWMIAFYFGATYKRLPTTPPEDKALGEIHEAEGEYGFFAPYSWWPIGLAFSAAWTVMGLMVGWWMFAIGVGMSLIFIIGWVFEFFHGDYSV